MLKMTNPFSSYQCIDATNIVRSNVHPSHIRQDIASLLDALDTLKDLRPPDSDTDEGTSLDRATVRKIDEKPGVLDLLEYYGFVRSNTGRYIYEPAETKSKKDHRRKGISEIRDLSEDLRSARRGSLDGFEEFIQNRRSNRHSYINDQNKSNDESLPSARDIENNNKATLALIELLKKSLVTDYSANPSGSFIRRRLARLAFKQKYPDSRNVDNDSVDITVDRKISSLKNKDRETNGSHTDHVYMECLIRTDFNETEAFEMLQKNPPNLEIPIEPNDPQNPTATSSLDNILEPLKQQCRLLNAPNNINRFSRQLSLVDEKWENVKHVVPAIQKLRQKSNGATADDAIFSQICRLLYSELLSIIGPESSFKIDMFARKICDSPLDRIENLDILTIKSILVSNGDIQISAQSLLSTPCPICNDSYPRNQLETMFLCDHQCCVDCLKGYYRTTIDEIQGARTLNKLTCFITPVQITTDIHLEFFTYLGAKIKQWFSDEPDVIKKYYDKVFEAARDNEIRRCANLTCTSSFYPGDGDDVARVRCPDCNFAQCGQCCQKWHDEHKEMSCEEYATWLIDNDPDDPGVQALKALGTNAIECPECQEIFEYKAGGCEHFTCPSCKTDFCRMCYERFYHANKGPKCPYKNCKPNTGFHAHCKPNCFREIRDSQTNAMAALLNKNGIDVSKQLQLKPVSKNNKCSTEDCGKDVSAATGNRLCENCYKQLLCTLIWNREIEPWELYEENNLQQILTKASIPIPANATKPILIQLCQQHLKKSLGKPKKLVKRKK